MKNGRRGGTKKHKGVTLMLKRFFQEETGQGMVEYGLIIALVSVVLIGALVAMNGGLQTIFGRITDAVNTAPGSPSS
ncbi:MAG: Flp family type IVb pilin [Bacteroidota bacterium]